MTAYDILSPIFRVLPEVPKPARRPVFRERILWTALVLIAYLAMSQIPLYGIRIRGEQYNPLLFLQVIMASKRGTLMELGIGPIVTAGIIWELLVGSQIVMLDLTSREGRILYAGVQKLLAIIFAAIEALAYIWGGAYGSLSVNTAILVFIQLLVASIIVLLMDEALQKGWGIGSAVSLFIAAGVAQQIFWEMFSPLGPLNDGLLYGVFPSFFQVLASGNQTLLSQIFLRRTGYPDLTGLFVMIFFLLVLTYLESMRLEIPVAISRYGGIRTRIPLKFLYVSNLPVILVSALYADIHIFAQALWPRLNPDNNNPWLNWIMMYNRTEQGTIPLKGSLVYYITPPRTIYALFDDPYHVAIYATMYI
ncbi:MAG: preprotein translocase subunit SecY, partial [Candidatus Aenigmatarchaeota archaeon]